MRPRRHLTLDRGLAAWVEIPGPGAVPLVLLHGGGFDHAGFAWGPVMDRLAGRVRMLAPDLPGYGQSASIGPVQTVPDLGHWVLDWMDAAGVGRCDLAGLSMGGGAALWIALEHPHRVRRLIPAASYGLMDRVPFHGALRRISRFPGRRWLYSAAAASDILARIGLGFAFARPWEVPAETVAGLREVAAEQADRQSFDAFLRGEIGATGTATSFTGRFEQIEQPTLMIHGTRDPLVPVRHARAAAARIPDCRYLELKTAHWPMQEHPGRVSAAIARFLDLPEPA